jgi:hypothetical protein
MFAFALPVGLLPFVFPVMICSETSRATAFDFYDGDSVIWAKNFLGCNSSASFHCFTPHYPKPLLWVELVEKHAISCLLSDDVGINLSYFDQSFCGLHP